MKRSTSTQNILYEKYLFLIKNKKKQQGDHQTVFIRGYHIY